MKPKLGFMLVASWTFGVNSEYQLPPEPRPLVRAADTVAQRKSPEPRPPTRSEPRWETPRERNLELNSDEFRDRELKLKEFFQAPPEPRPPERPGGGSQSDQSGDRGR